MNPAYLEDPDLADAAFGELFAELNARGNRPPIPVGPTLQRMLDGQGIVPLRRRPRIGRGPLIGLAVAGTVAGGLGAAAADELPRPLQRVVSTVVNNVTPFTIATGTEQEPGDAPAAPVTSVSPEMPHGSSAGTDEDEREDSSVEESTGNQAPSGSEADHSDDGAAVDNSVSEAGEQEDSVAEHSTSSESGSDGGTDNTEADASSTSDDSSSDGGGSGDDASDNSSDGSSDGH